MARPPGCPQNKWLDKILSVPQETSEGALSAVDTVVQRRDGPRWLRDYDDDDDDGLPSRGTRQTKAAGGILLT